MNNKGQEEYEDDFEKDLDWLISEEGKSVDQDGEYEDIEAQIDKELEEDEEAVLKKHKGRLTVDNAVSDPQEDEERWPTPLEPLEGLPEPDAEEASKLPPPPPLPDAEMDEEKKYILEKIQQANRELQDQEAPDLTRRRRLQFKDTLVDLVVPAVDYGSDGPSQDTGAEQEATAAARDLEGEVSGKMLQLKISPQDEGSGALRSNGQEETSREGRVLVEKDGKFDLVSLKEVEGLGLLPPLSCPSGDNLPFQISPRKTSPALAHAKSPTSSPRPSSVFSLSLGAEHLHTPKPPPKPRNRPNSASHSLRRVSKEGTKRRVQSASSAPPHATFTLTPQQKEHLLRLQQKKERLTKEEEQRRREEEEQKKQENELAFQAWLVRKREQLNEDRRLQRAQEMERMNGTRDPSDPQEAFKQWLQRKQEQQERERQLEEMKKMELEGHYYLHDRERSEKAFKQWLKRKRAEKRAEQQAARERSRRMVLEERRARRMQDILCTVNEAKAFRFADPYSYHF
ncbi:coiled-coil domain-containing protein 181 [Clupea harengus]|uniref:Coiled-coil domain-containing protein 181 n=1 Tax=Clupea harengus TaxID=7950 RepID=A0A6P8G3N3_CLUHA|nr:coiled-coil domain-containing protein 181 [Clupea harengus]XP_031430460.1 coiled-coil domain-containing protein 181 [Clupea harengus]XP_031430461.1 coiled-coil domain-containing protein 181 [Clupea harengus]XP_031430462.1 coiled-coil domain-containing protein 181 [Clupea harengus]